MAKTKKQNVIATFAATVKRLIDDAGSQGRVGKGKRAKQRTLSRWASGDGSNPGLLQLQDLATSMDVEVWQLLVPGFDPKHPPQLAGAEHNIGPQELALLKSIRDATAETKFAINAVLAADRAKTAQKEST